MDDTSNIERGLRPVLGEIREHLLKAQELMDAINPDSIFGARIQHLIDGLQEQNSTDDAAAETRKLAT
jgi:hypothetical protein